jgi:hypothetical protein
VVDEQGVALASIQGLYALVQEKDTTIQAQQGQLDALRQPHRALLQALDDQGARPTALERGRTTLAAGAPLRCRPTCRSAGRWRSGSAWGCPVWVLPPAWRSGGDRPADERVTRPRE